MQSGWSSAANERRQRARLLIGMAAFLVLGVITRLFVLQVVNAGEYRRLADSNYLRPEKIPAMRGVIRDRNGVLLASSMPSFSATIDPWNEVFRKGPRGATVLAAIEDHLRGVVAGAT